ncbi:lytic transglycosylase domain-containing protein [Rubrimonas cliftonensis]|uniref:Soluble lytic murein transglycosylase n=1 Tax=Rubrimonas cliftonensis TaxID=89524 RepID=A0A1H4G999_9RHOB|nr:lytic transglycosylase domain-containing protein [Rubrimonas cliftonensis]SEB06169.1 soluble lytic murein transglycosylase [Rubrimonas cliftonensis]
MFAPILAAFLILAPTLAPAQSARDATAVRAVFERADAGDFDGAAQAARGAADPVVADLALWRLGVSGQAGYRQIAGLLERRPDWPRGDRLRIEAERAMPAGLPPAEVRAFFAGRPPLSGSGALALADALAASGDRAGAEAALVRAWTEYSLTQAEREAFESRHGALARRYAAARLDAMLWDGDADQARAILPLVDDGWRRLAEARMRLRARANGVDAAIEAVPANLSNDPGLAYERFVWRARAGLDAGAEQLITQRTGSAAALGRPEAWADRRLTLARSAFREGRVAEAYRLASLHHLTTGTDFAELEWLSGWIALRGLRDPDRAAGHFLRHYNDVTTPISRGRGGYWLGRAYEAAGDGNRARLWYERGAEHPTSFYGQLAAERVGRDVTAELAAHDRQDWRRSPFAGSDTQRAIALLHAAGRRNDVRFFFISAAEHATRAEEYAALGDYALSLDRPDAAIRVAKRAARDPIVLMDIYYPVASAAAGGGPVEPAFALAIARTESEMNVEAISPAGARGLMQLMPGTAQKVSRDIGLGYDLGRLTTDPAYNARLGQTYLAEMLSRFNGAKMLAAAAYNAGPGRPEQWIGRFGDPRGAADAVDWIETIPFNETRNYVMRVLEGVHVYRARLGAPTSASYRAALTRPQG